jgi:hypothetical protein
MADGNGNGNGGEGQQGGGGTPAPGEGVTFESWLGEQEEAVQGLVNDEVAGLRSALQSERQQRREFERELRDAARELEEGSEARTRLESMADELDTVERRADFYEAAHGAGVTNLRLAWLAVQQDESLSDRRGNVNMARLKKNYPELFGGGQRSPPPGNAGSGTDGGAPPATGGMNEFIRRSAGRDSG